MLIKNTLKYLPAQLLSPAAQLISMILWTHWLAPVEMGLFTLVSVAQEIAYTVCLSWFSVYALRYLPAAEDLSARQKYLGTENVVVLCSLLASLLAAVITAWSLHDNHPLWQDTLVIGLFFATRAINAHYAERARAQSAFVAYSILQMAGPLGGFGLGWLAFQSYEASALVLLMAYVAAQALGSVLALPMLGMSRRLARLDRDLLKAAIGFGGPILGLGVLGWAAENYIRYLVQWMSGAEALGLMIVGWSLGRRCASVASMLVTTAAFPLASRLLNEGRRDDALAQLRINAALLIAVLLPVTAGLQLLGPLLLSLVVAPVYLQTTIELLGLSVLAGMLRNLHVHISGQLMILERRMAMHASLSLLEIVACAIASALGLYFYGLHGAVIGQAIGSTLTLVVSVYLVCSRLGFSWPWPETLKVIGATAVMAVAIGWLQSEANLLGLLVATVVGVLAYALAMALFFGLELRRLLARK